MPCDTPAPNSMPLGACRLKPLTVGKVLHACCAALVVRVCRCTSIYDMRHGNSSILFA